MDTTNRMNAVTWSPAPGQGLGGGPRPDARWLPSQEGPGTRGVLRVTLLIMTTLIAVTVVTLGGDLGRRGLAHMLKAQGRGLLRRLSPA